MRKRRPLFLRQEAHQVALDFLRLRMLAESQAPRYPFHMGVHHHAGNPKCVPEHHVCRLSSHAAKPGQFRNGPGNPATELLRQLARHGLQRPRLETKQSQRFDNLLDLITRRATHRLGIGVALEQSRRYEVNLSVGTLGGENRRHQQFKGVAVLEGCFDFRKLQSEPLDHCRDTLCCRNSGGPFLAHNFSNECRILKIRGFLRTGRGKKYHDGEKISCAKNKVDPREKRRRSYEKFESNGLEQLGTWLGMVRHRFCSRRWEGLRTAQFFEYSPGTGT